MVSFLDLHCELHCQKCFLKIGPADSTWVTTISPFPFKQTVNGTFASQSSYTQEIHIKVYLYVHAVERQQFEWGLQKGVKDVVSFIDDNHLFLSSLEDQMTF